MAGGPIRWASSARRAWPPSHGSASLFTIDRLILPAAIGERNGRLMRRPVLANEGANVDFWDLMRLLIRRWKISVPVLLVSLGLTFLPIGAATPDYIATSYLQLVPPMTQPAKPGQAITQRNPWLGQDLSTLGDAAIVTLQDQSVLDHMKAAGLSDSYTLQMGSDSAAVETYQAGPTIPIVTLEVVAKSRRQAEDTANELITRFDASIASLQTAYGVTATDLITSHRLDLGNNILKSNASVKRVAAALLIVAVLATIAATAGIDAWLSRRWMRPAAGYRPAATVASRARSGHAR